MRARICALRQLPASWRLDPDLLVESAIQELQARLVLDDMRLEDFAEARPFLAIEAHAVEAFDGGVGHEQRVVRVVVGEQPQPSK